MTHDQARALLPRYAAGKLDIADAAPVRAHLATGCAGCLRELFSRPIRSHDVAALAHSASRAPLAPALQPPLIDYAPPAASVDHASPSPPLGHAAPVAAIDPVPPPRSDPGSVPAGSRRTVVAALSVIALAGLAVWGTSEMREHALRPSQQSARFAGRILELEGKWSELSTRLAKAVHDLEDARNERSHRAALSKDPTDSDASADPQTAPAAAVVLLPDRSAKKPPPGIRYADGAVSVHVANMTIAEVLKEISRQSGAVIRHDRNDMREVSVGFDGVPLPDALRRLLGEPNFLLVYDKQRRPRRVELLAGPSTSPVGATMVASGVSPAAGLTMAAAPGPQAASPAPEAPSLESAVALLERHGLVPLEGKLVQALGTDKMPLQQLIRSGLQHDDKEIRAEAMRTSVAAMQTDPELRSGVLDTLASLDEAALGEFVEEFAGERAEEALFYMATQVRTSALRDKAASLLHRLHIERVDAERAEG